MRVCGLARSYIKSSNPHSVAWVCLLAFPSSEGWGGGCLKKTANQAENEATVCVCSCVLELKRKGKKRKSKEASHRSGFMADWSENRNLQKSLLHFHPTGSQICLFTCAVFFRPFAGLAFHPDLSSLTFGLCIRENLCSAAEQKHIEFC